jgi:hypothetical protein
MSLPFPIPQPMCFSSDAKNETYSRYLHGDVTSLCNQDWGKKKWCAVRSLHTPILSWFREITNFSMLTVPGNHTILSLKCMCVLSLIFFHMKQISKIHITLSRLFDLEAETCVPKSLYIHKQYNYPITFHRCCFRGRRLFEVVSKLGAALGIPILIHTKQL